MSKKILLLALVVLLSLVLGFITFTPIQAIAVVQHAGYWIISLVFVTFCFRLGSSLRGEWLGWNRLLGRWPSMAIIVGGVLLLHVHEEHGFKIVADEIVLSSTAMQMHFERQSTVVMRGYDFSGNFEPFLTFVDKRPLFFPYLLSLVHDLTGYRVSNVFFLNGVISGLLLAVFYLLGARIGGEWGGAAAILLICSVPLVAQMATGGGFELLNLLMIVLTLWLGVRYAERVEESRLDAFILSGVLLSQTRYESVLFILPVGVTVAYLWWQRQELSLTWTVICTPLFMVLYPLQHNVFKVSEATWQLNDVAGATSPFGFKYFYDNIGHALNFFFTVNGTQPSSWLVGGMGILAVGFVVLVLYRQHREIFSRDSRMAVLCIFLLTLMLHTGLMLCYFWGKWDDVIIRRLSLPAHILLILSILFVWPRLVEHARRWQLLVVGVAFYVVGFAIPTMAMHRYTQENFASRTTNWIGSYIRSLGEKSALVIDNNSGLEWFLYRKSSITPILFQARFKEYVSNFKKRSFNEFLIVQRAGVDPKTGKAFISFNDEIGPGMQLELIEEKAYSPIYFVRLSRIVGIDEDKMNQWLEERQKLNKNMADSKASRTSGPTLVPIYETDPEKMADFIRNLP